MEHWPVRQSTGGFKDFFFFTCHPIFGEDVEILTCAYFFSDGLQNNHQPVSSPLGKGNLPRRSGWSHPTGGGAASLRNKRIIILSHVGRWINPMYSVWCIYIYMYVMCTFYIYYYMIRVAKSWYCHTWVKIQTKTKNKPEVFKNLPFVWYPSRERVPEGTAFFFRGFFQVPC